MKVIIESEVENAEFIVSFLKNGRTLQETFRCPSTNHAVRCAYDSCPDSDGFSMLSNGEEVASGFGIPGMKHLEIIK